MIMPWKEFAVELFKLEDSDPIYYTVARTDIDLDQKKRFFIGWCTFYNPGIAAKASQYHGKNFWIYLRQVYATAKRASERRHFRGQAGMLAIDQWENKFVKPEKMMDYMMGDTYFEVKKHTDNVHQYGIYLTFKVGDFQERVLQIPCDFTGAEPFTPKVPQLGAKLIAPHQTIKQTYDMITWYMNHKQILAPPFYDRATNLQESESVCCIFKQHSKGKWAPYTRTAKATNSFIATPSKTGEEMLLALHQKTKVSRKEMKQWAVEKLEQLK